MIDPTKGLDTHHQTNKLPQMNQSHAEAYRTRNKIGTFASREKFREIKAIK